MLNRIKEESTRKELEGIIAKDLRWQMFFEDGIRELDAGRRTIISHGKMPVFIKNHLDFSIPLEINESVDSWAKYILRIERGASKIKNMSKPDTLCRILGGEYGECVIDHDDMINGYAEFNKICGEDEHPDRHCTAIVSPSGKLHHHFRFDGLRDKDFYRFRLALKPETNKNGDAYEASMGEMKTNGFITISKWDEKTQSNSMKLLSGDKYDIPYVKEDLVKRWYDIYEQISQIKFKKPELAKRASTIDSEGWEPSSNRSYSSDTEKFIKIVAAKYNEANSVIDLAESVGCTVYGQYFCRPGKSPSAGPSGYIDEGKMTNFSSSFIYYRSPSASQCARDMGETFTAFGLYAAIHHHGDQETAARRLCSKYDVKTPEEFNKEEIKHAEIKKTTEEIIREELRLAGQIEEDKKHDISDVWEILPGPVRELTKAIAASNPVNPQSNAMMQAITLAGGIIGKKVKAHNYARKYYAAEWLLSMQPTGSNKTAIKGLKDPLDKVAVYLNKMKSVSSPTSSYGWGHIRDEGAPYKTISPNWTTAGLYMMIGQTITNKQINELDEDAQQILEDALSEKMSKSKGCIAISDEMALTLESLISRSGAAKASSADLSSVLQLADNDGHISDTTKGDGHRFISHPCITIISVTQPSTWLRKFSDPSFKEAGLIGRFSVFLPDSFKNNLFAAEGGNYHECSDRLHNAILTLAQKSCSIDYTEFEFASYDDDYIDRAINLIRTNKTITTLEQYHKDEYQDWKNKMMVSAMRRCITHAVFSESEVEIVRPSEEVFAKYFLLSAKQWLSYIQMDEPRSESDEAILQIYRQLMKAEKTSGKPDWVQVRDIQRRDIKTHGKPLGVEGIRVLLETMHTKQIIDIKIKSKNGYDSIVAARWTGEPLNLSILR